MKAYDLIDHGFCLNLDMRLYAREAVMKALYRFHDQYAISYEIDGHFLRVYFETSAGDIDCDTAVSPIMKELDFQMIRRDTIRQTKGIRELLVARSLYATCIEPERDKTACTDEENDEDWQEDQDRIFSSWFEET